MSFVLPELPYAKDALAPIISEETLQYHWGKHHNAYVTKLNAAVKGKPYEKWTLEELITKLADIPEAERKGVFNNAAQHYNHSFYWKCMCPGGSEVPAPLLDAINKSFGSFEAFKELFLKEATLHFGSGWAWLAKDSQGALKVIGTHDADTPIAHGLEPMLTVDVWEHAFYIDYRNDKPKYLNSFWSIIDWQFVASHL